jgi:protein TonB
MVETAVSNAASRDRLAGLLFVLAMHAAALYALWSYRILPSPAEAMTVFVNFINPPPPPLEPPKPELPKPVKLEKPRPVEPARPQQLVVEAPVVSPAEPVAPAPPKEPPPVTVAAPPAAPASKPAGPITLADDLSVACPNRVPPVYPPFSRRFAEQGRVVLQVELDERGKVTNAVVATSSGSPRLDEAALAAVRQWSCNPAMRGGVAVRATALQPFNFILEGR